MATVLLSAMPVFTRTVLALLALGAAAASIKRVKYGGFQGVDASLSPGEMLALSALAAVLVVAGPWVGGLLALVLVAACVALGLDAVLFRVFTIELGPGGVGDIVLPVLYRELSQLAYARKFFRAHALFPLVAPALAVAAFDAALGSRGRIHVVLQLAAAALFAISSRAATRTDTLARALSIALVVGIDAALGPGPGALAALVALGLSAFGARRSVGGSPAGLGHFFRSRVPHHDPAFTPRGEHVAVLEHAPAAPKPSSRHGALRGADVLLFTFESVGRNHLEMYAGASGAQARFCDDLGASGISSLLHFCPSPTTNNAHVALYHSDYAEGRQSAVASLAAAGYHTVYLTAARTREYGLRGLLERAGFEATIDADDLRGEDGDWALMTAGVEALEKLARDDRPLFLHVHATNTHLPYRVEQPARFNRFDAETDEGRFRNGIEEADRIFKGLWQMLRSRKIVREPLVIVTSDHGQAFGAMGYQSHGSAVIADEVLVPFAMGHPSLRPRAVECSSHFDVLPTALDLLGISQVEPSYGVSLLGDAPHPVREPGLLLWAGHPSRTTTTNYGLVSGGKKYMADLVLDRYHRMDWDDRNPELLAGAERDYVAALLGRLMRLRGVR